MELTTLKSMESEIFEAAKLHLGNDVMTSDLDLDMTYKGYSSGQFIFQTKDLKDEDDVIVRVNPYLMMVEVEWKRYKGMPFSLGSMVKN